MDLGTLRYFEAVARCGSISAASRALGVSQPTISNAILGLERELDTRLLNRTSTGVTLTVTGNELFARSHELFALHDDTLERIRELEGGETGEFVLAVAEEIATWLVPMVLQELVPSLPGVAVKVKVERGAEAARAVQAREAHFALLVEPERLPDLVLVTIGHDRAGLFAGEALSAHRGMGRSTLPSLASRSERAGRGLASLASAVLAWAEHDRLATRWLEAADAAGLRPARTLPLGSSELVRRVARLGVAFGVLPRAQAALHAGLVELPVDLSVEPMALGVAYRADLHRTHAALRVKDLLVDIGRAACGSPSAQGG